VDISSLVYVHITAGAFALFSGGTAIFSRKGAWLHRAAGNAFFVAMIVMCVAALPVAFARQQAINVAAASFTLYLVSTAWTAAVRPDGVTGRFETFAALAGASIAIGALTYGATMAKSFAPAFYLFGALAAFGSIIDVRMISRGGVSGVGRITRHLWRMSVSLFVATGSFFFGQQQVLPDWLRGSPLQMVLGLAPLGLLVFWLVVVAFTKRFRAPQPA